MDSIYKMKYEKLGEIISMLAMETELDTNMNVMQLIEYLDDNVGEIIIE